MAIKSVSIRTEEEMLRKNIQEFEAVHGRIENAILL